MHHYCIHIHRQYFYLCTGQNHSNGKHQESFKLTKDNDLFSKPTKCEFNKTKVEYLGMVIEEGKISMDPGIVFVSLVRLGFHHDLRKTGPNRC